ncbi:YbaN family protein [Lacimicrobium alkaliphilum]|uniref:Inner membrane protein n=1 Tax=Lacimicrobium alkaliphilum TaxID=1526571 RepID=A0ABQ1RV11_9ALTE|nr:YbaN family protein [Lacimicrobium alkaliphilum]GGD79195.1 inner membrane protein [Lacimicrobium alkaliphilum]
MDWVRALHWKILAIVSLLLGVAGIPLPGLPTVPFILLAAWSGSKGWPQLEDWLLRHPRFGKDIANWRRYGAVSRRAKYLASGMMLLSTTLLWISASPVYLQLAVTLILVCVALWLWRRPETTSTTD